MAKRLGVNHELAGELWVSGVHEARLLAGMLDDPNQVTGDQMESWAAEFDSWDVVDGICALFDRTPFAYRKAMEWSNRPEEFVKWAAFSLMAELSVHDKDAGDEAFRPFFPIIEREAGDPRNFVRKAVNWALRQIGKRNLALNGEAIEVARRIHDTGPPVGQVGGLGRAPAAPERSRPVPPKEAGSVLRSGRRSDRHTRELTS
jgi:3-methyladenine DNA glycosylase AlkD